MNQFEIFSKVFNFLLDIAQQKIILLPTEKQLLRFFVRQNVKQQIHLQSK